MFNQRNVSVFLAAGLALSCSSDDETGSKRQGLEARTVSVAAVADTHVRRGERNANFGYKSIFKVRRHNRNRSLIRFSPDEVREKVGTGTLTSATLELTIAENPGNWGENGRDLDLHRLNVPFTEFGATWNCASDDNTLNDEAECPSANWDMDDAVPWSAAVIDSVRLQTGQGGSVTLDVTSEVSEILSGADHEGFVLKLQKEGKKGHVKFWAREGLFPPRLILNFDSDEPEPPSPPEPVLAGELPIVADTYVRSKKRNQNYGDRADLIVRKHKMHRTLVRVDETAIAPLLDGGTLAKATLELSPLEAKSWDFGRTIAVHRLTQGFSETTATWNCPDDTDLANSSADCDPAWNMAEGPTPWDPVALGTAVIQTGQTEAVTLDVTTDVQAILGGAPHYGWLIRKSNTFSTGFVRFSSREGTTGPKLILYTTADTCEPESDAEFCSRLGAECGALTAPDNCEETRTAECGSCTAPDTCGGSRHTQHLRLHSDDLPSPGRHLRHHRRRLRRHPHLRHLRRPRDLPARQLLRVHP